VHLLIFVAPIFLMSLIIVAFDSGAEQLSRSRPKAEMIVLAGVGVAAVAMLLAIVGMAALYT
jgi:hypothetical protein